ncbi:hypothetical protein CLV84_1740 [Neolewinella xylanilytica]|uniref:Uncharacterized protein n=1 Tax=Neolewinella xylanilytica TaxID=1514080 RepID=A0A2S6IBE1_9BACT|nr:hypothetical protein [Neolewinella xylanilytica]PPK88769.1 hypothetical protein CLV84_1740 [Neolewinella xylanilytica]
MEKQKLQRILDKYPGAFITDSGIRSVAIQAQFVQARPKQYPKTLRQAVQAFDLDEKKLTDDNYLKTLYKGREAWLHQTIRETARKQQGFYHVAGHAIDVSVRRLSLEQKRRLQKELAAEGYSLIMERVRGMQAKYYVSIERANVFHVQSGTR